MAVRYQQLDGLQLLLVEVLEPPMGVLLNEGFTITTLENNNLVGTN